MIDYAKQLEQQNEELRQKLAVAESKVADYESMTNYARFQKALQDDPEGAWGWYCNIAMPIKDNSAISHNTSQKLAVVLMKHLWDIDITKNKNYKESKE